MSAAVLHSDNSNWRPTVIQIGPFSHDGKEFTVSRPSVSNVHSNSARKGKRNYPILAVTRSNSCTTFGSEGVAIDGSKNVPFSGRPPTEFIKSFYRGKNITPSDSVKSSVSDCVEKKYSILDLNEQNCDIHTEPQFEYEMEQSQFSTRDRKKNTKSVLSERKYFYGANGIMRGLKPTPGELELEKHKVNYAREQAQKRKKYKLNVNQLPRSTTPIHDHDPDKLNMKQVIQFLQKKNGTKMMPQKQSGAGKVSINSDSDSQRIRTIDMRPETEIIATTQRVPLETVRPSTEPPRDDTKSDSESRIASRNSCYSKDSFGSRSVLSTQSVPIMESKGKRTHCKRGLSSSKSFKDRVDRGKHSRKSAKEFKLYRFLALAPNGMGQTTVPDNQESETRTIYSSEHVKHKEIQKKRSTEDGQARVTYRAPMIREQIPASKFSENRLQGNKISAQDGTDKVEQRRVSRTSSLMHRRALIQYRDKVRLIRAENYGEDDESKNAIRLPSVHDFEDSVRHQESEEDEPSSADDRSYQESDIRRLEVSSLLSSRSDQTCNRSVSYHPSLVIHANHLDNNNNKNKKLFVNVPKQSDTGTKEVIKLTLRQERDVTREQSYMHDIATPRENNVYTMMCQHLNQTLPQYSDDEFYDRRMYQISAVSIHEENNYNMVPDESTLTVHETLANSCIKVRQKLKGSVHND